MDRSLIIDFFCALTERTKNDPFGNPMYIFRFNSSACSVLYTLLGVRYSGKYELSGLVFSIIKNNYGGRVSKNGDYIKFSTYDDLRHQVFTKVLKNLSECVFGE